MSFNMLYSTPPYERVDKVCGDKCTVRYCGLLMGNPHPVSLQFTSKQYKVYKYGHAQVLLG